jgi:hypothetical protein
MSVAKNKQKDEVPLRPYWVSTATADVTVYCICNVIVSLRHLEQFTLVSLVTLLYL